MPFLDCFCFCVCGRGCFWFFFNASPPCVAGAWPWQWQQKWYFSQDERLPLRQFLRGSRTVLVLYCFLCTLQLCLWDFSKCFAKWTTQLFICRFLVRVSYLEIYNEEVRDLLGKDQTQRLEVSFLFWMWYLFWIRAIFCFKDQRNTCREVRGWAPQQSSFLCNAIAGCHCWLLWISSTWSVAQTGCSTWGSFVPAVLPQRPLSSPGNWRLGFKIMSFPQRKTSILSCTSLYSLSALIPGGVFYVQARKGRSKPLYCCSITRIAVGDLLGMLSLNCFSLRWKRDLMWEFISKTFQLML